jgi:hypothetical protein
MKNPKDKSVKNLKRLIKAYSALHAHKNKMNKKTKEGVTVKPYEPLFDSPQEIKLAKAKLVLLGEDTNDKFF